MLGGLAVLVIAGAVGAWQLSGFVERTTHEQLALLGAKMGRDITLGHLGVHLLPRPAVSVTRLIIGPEKANPQDGIPAVE